MRSPLKLLLLVLLPAPIDAQRPYQAESGIEWLAPTKEDRRISTLQVDLGIRRTFPGSLGLSVRGGLTLSRAWGHIIQLDSTLNEVRYENDAVALGPTAQARIAPIRIRSVTLGAEVSAGLLLYAPSFPAGGKHYNGMFRVGPTLTVPLAPGTTMTLAGHWMHVSNGRGLVPSNPSYEGRGLELTIGRPVTTSSPGRPPGVRAGGVVGAVLGGVVGAVASHHCDDGTCAPGPGITVAGVLSGGALGAVLGGVLGARR